VAARILIVEDEQIIAADLRNQLRRMGHEVVGMAVSGEEAIEIFLTAFPGVFLRDPSQMTEPGICLGKPFSRPQLEAALGAALGDGGTRQAGVLQ
jgi:DNA-binding NtrC family response regulator